MACVTACPSGVRYDILIEETRARLEKQGRRSWLDRLQRSMIFALFPYPSRLRAAAAASLLYSRTGLQTLVRRSGLLRLLPARVAQLDALMPPVSRRSLSSRLPERVAAKGDRRARIALLSGCVQGVFFPEVNQATIRVLSAEGCEVRIPRGQGCCGALSVHAGRHDEALAFARRAIAALDEEPVDAILVNAAGCGSTMKDYGRMFENDPAWAARATAFSARVSARVSDINECVADPPAVAPRNPIRVRVAFHDACHLSHAQRVRQQPRRLLRAIPGLELVEIPDGEQCCGSAGIYNLVEPESADEIGARKAENVLQTRATSRLREPGCTLQIQKMLRQWACGFPPLIHRDPRRLHRGSVDRCTPPNRP
jgi:glycolate oxidase iron-sulfur subunit